MKTIRLVAAAAAMLPAAGIASCSGDDPVQNPPVDIPATGHGDNAGSDGAGEDSTANMIEIKIGTATFKATLAESATADAFAAMLPMTVTMEELNGNEKYHYLPSRLPSAATRPDTIHAGDLMLYGSDCVVLFYETFRTSYSYTPIGRITDAGGLADAAGTGDVEVTFAIAE